MSYRAVSTQEDLWIADGQEDALRDALINAYAPDDTPDVVAALHWVGFQGAFRAESQGGAVFINGVASDNACDNVDEILRVMAPFLRHGSSIAFVGEDQEVWMYVVLYGQLIEVDARLVPLPPRDGPAREWALAEARAMVDDQ